MNVELNESFTATSRQDAALCGHQTSRQYTIQPPFRFFFSPLSRPHGLCHSGEVSPPVHLISMVFDCNLALILKGKIFHSKEDMHMKTIKKQTKSSSHKAVLSGVYDIV